MRDIEKVASTLPGVEVKEGFLVLAPASLLSAMEGLKKLGGFMLFDICSVDRPEGFEVSYRFLDMTENSKEVLTLRVLADRSNPELPSSIGIWKAADVLEREVWDLMGIRFSGRPSLERILNRSDFEGHPLRKDFIIAKRERFPEESWSKKAAEGGQ